MQSLALPHAARKPSRHPDPHPDADFRHRLSRLHAFGARSAGEILAEIMGRYPRSRPFVEQRLERYAKLDPALIAYFGGRDWIEPAIMVRLVAEGRP